MNLHPSRTRETRSEAIRGKRIRKHFQMMVLYAESIVRTREMTNARRVLQERPCGGMPARSA